MYVAVTRAKVFLTLTWAANRGETRRRQSPFLAELSAGVDETQLDRRGQPKKRSRVRGRRGVVRESRLKPKEGSAQMPRAKRKKSEVRVRHPKFGDGTVKSIRSNKYVVQFDQVGEKTILSSYLEILG